MKNTTGPAAVLATLAFGLLALPLMQLAAAADGMLNMSGSFDGWRQIGDANWRIEDGEFVADGGSGHLVTQDSFTDFHMSAEFWVSEGANSGIFFRASDPNQVVDRNAYEANIYDNRPDPAYRTGGIVNHASPLVNLDTANKWNTYEITAQGDHIVLVLNGETTVDFRDTTYASGPITLQYGAGTVKFRNVQIESL
jgi:hypothetical protein